MRLGSFIALGLAVTAAAGSAHATPPKRAPKLTVVRIMSDAGQALIHDRTRGEYVVVREGQTLSGFVVTEVDEDQVVLTTPTDPPTHYVMPLVTAATAAASASKPAEAASVADPYGAEPAWGWGAGFGSGPESGSASAVIDPYAEEPPRGSFGSGTAESGTPGSFGSGTAESGTPGSFGSSAAESGTTTVLAPEGSRAASPIEVTSPASEPPKTADAGKATEPTKTAESAATGPVKPTEPTKTAESAATGPVKPTEPAKAAESAKATEPTKVTESAKATSGSRVTRAIDRDDFDRAMGDFHARSKEIVLSVEDRGIRIVDLSRGSFFSRLGLQKGDLVVSVAGHSVRDPDEAALVYVELSRVREFDAVVDRAGTPLTIRYQFSK